MSAQNDTAKSDIRQDKKMERQQQRAEERQLRNAEKDNRREKRLEQKMERQATIIEQDTLKLLSWNIFMLPRIVPGRPDRKARANGIAERLLEMDYDVVIFQEAFAPNIRRRIFKKIKHKFPNKIRVGNRKIFSHKFNSGVWVVGKIPIKKFDEISFSRCDGFDNCMTRKGAVMVEAKYKGHDIQIVGTHINAGGSEETRVHQLNEIYELLLKKHQRKGVPQFICGDMNISQCNSNLYKRMTSTLRADDVCLGDNGFTSDGSCNSLKSNQKEKHKIDYILFRKNGHASLKNLTGKVKRFKKQWCEKYNDLSDHFAVEAQFLLERKNNDKTEEQSNAAGRPQTPDVGEMDK